MYLHRESSIAVLVVVDYASTTWSILNHFVTVQNRRCPDPQKPCSVLYNEDSDRLEAVRDANQSVDTEDGPILLTGIMHRR